MAQEIRTDFWGRPEFARGEYRLTFVEDEGLTRRLVKELKAVGREAGLTYPEFKRDPVGFTWRSVAAYGRAGWGFFAQRNVALATLSAFVFVTLLLGTVFALERMRARHLAAVNPYENLEIVGYVENEIPKDQPQPDSGPAGTNEGRGGGSKPKGSRLNSGSVSPASCPTAFNSLTSLRVSPSSSTKVRRYSPRANSGRPQKSVRISCAIRRLSLSS